MLAANAFLRAGRAQPDSTRVAYDVAAANEAPSSGAVTESDDAFSVIDARGIWAVLG